MIAYAFPPEGAAGSYRPLRFVRHLPQLGWHTTVICADKSVYERYDPELVSSIPKETAVIRVRHHDPWQAIQAKRARRIEKGIGKTINAEIERPYEPQQTRWRSFLREHIHKAEAWCYYPDAAMTWIWSAVQATVKACRTEKPRAIWATGQPWSSFLVAGLAWKRTGVPYVMDFRGLWTVVPNASPRLRPGWARWLDRRILAKLFQEARSIVVFSDVEAECISRAYKGALDSSKIHIIPNGFDGTIESYQAPTGGKCTLLYTGTLSQHRFDTLLHALRYLKESAPSLANQLCVRIFSDNVNELTQQVISLGLSEIVRTSGPTTNAEITRLERQAHAFLMLGVASTVKGYETIVGSKLFGYMKTGKPIVGVLPEGEARRILHHIGVSTIADVDSQAEIVAVLRRLLDAWSMQNLSSLAPVPRACEVYSSESQTKALIRALDGIAPVAPFIPGSVEIPPSLRDIVGNDSNTPLGGSIERELGATPS